MKLAEALKGGVRKHLLAPFDLYEFSFGGTPAVLRAEVRPADSEPFVQALEKTSALLVSKRYEVYQNSVKTSLEDLFRLAGSSRGTSKKGQKMAERTAQKEKDRLRDEQEALDKEVEADRKLLAAAGDFYLVRDLKRLLQSISEDLVETVAVYPLDKDGEVPRDASPLESLDKEEVLEMLLDEDPIPEFGMAPEGERPVALEAAGCPIGLALAHRLTEFSREPENFVYVENQATDFLSTTPVGGHGKEAGDPSKSTGTKPLLKAVAGSA